VTGCAAQAATQRASVAANSNRMVLFCGAVEKSMILAETTHSFLSIPKTRPIRELARLYHIPIPSLKAGNQQLGKCSVKGHASLLSPQLFKAGRIGRRHFSSKNPIFAGYAVAAGFIARAVFLKSSLCTTRSKTSDNREPDFANNQPDHKGRTGYANYECDETIHDPGCGVKRG
jgi:hypothetical protein